MVQFISTNYIDGAKVVTIDGATEGITKSRFDDGEAVQLRRARSEESGFNWLDGSIKKVVAKNLLIYDAIDIACLNWFIRTKIEIDFTNAYVSPDALNILQDMIAELKESGIKVVPGSSIRLPICGGYSGMGRSEGALYGCKSIGFNAS